jgi:hypothetical protein
MAQDVEIAVIGQYLEALIVHAIPLIQDVTDFKDASTELALKGKPQRPFIGLVAGVTFDFEVDAHDTSISVPKACHSERSEESPQLDYGPDVRGGTAEILRFAQNDRPWVQ